MTGSDLKIEAIVGFNTFYAGWQHEGHDDVRTYRNWTTPGSGPKYLEAKLLSRQLEYMKAAAQKIKEEMR
jgi:hypothetical protein